MPPPAEPATLLRFSAVVRVVHAATGALVLTCIVTAAILYNGQLAITVGHRYVVEQVHVWCGFAIPVPLIAGAVQRDYRHDLARLNRFARDDWRWLRAKSRRDGTIPVGKFNAGQKLNAALSGGALATLLLTGTVMYFTGLVQLTWRRGATFAHDWFALGLGLLVLGHILFAVRDPIAMRGMRTGRVPARWARREHAAWAAELDPDDPR